MIYSSTSRLCKTYESRPPYYDKSRKSAHFLNKVLKRVSLFGEHSQMGHISGRDPVIKRLVRHLMLFVKNG